MELCYLDYEMFPKDSQSHLTSTDQSTPTLTQSGNVQYDPNEKSLIFYDPNTKFIFTIPITSIQINSDFLNQNKIVFDYNKKHHDITGSSEVFQIHIFNNKKETLGERTLKILLHVFYKRQLKTDKGDHKKSKSKYIIASPKDYQLEMLEEAKKGNVVIFLETGLGKTYIAILLIKSVYDEPLQANHFNSVSYIKKTKKKVLCLFKTVSLLLQQAKVIKHNTNLKILKLYGNSENSRLYLHSKFNKVMEKNDIICATPESIYRCFTFGYLVPEDLELIVIDECHHTRENDFYNLILKHFILCNEENRKRIRILGLTASPCAEKVIREEAIYDSIVTLCNNLNGKLVCPSNIIKKEIANDDNDDDSSSKTLSLIKHRDITFLDISNNGNNTQAEAIKLFLFHQLILPLLDWYFASLIIPEANNEKEEEEEGSQFNTHPGLPSHMKEKDKKSLQAYLCIYIMSHYLTLTCDEARIEEKFLGLYTKSDIEHLSSYLTFFTAIQDQQPHSLQWITIDSIKDIIGKLSTYDLRDDNEKINFSFELREFLKEHKSNTILKDIKKYTKAINLVIKYLDIESISNYTSTAFNDIQKEFFNLYKTKTYISDISTISYLDKFSVLLSPIRKLHTLNDYISPYLSELISFISNDQSKTILFVDQRILCKEINRKVNSLLKANGQGYTCSYAIGIVNSNTNVVFSERELKENIALFKTDDNCKMLIATNVVEEGIDVPQCNNIICLSEIKTIKEYIQKTGRARMKDSRLMLFSNLTDQEAKKDNLKEIEISLKVMKDIISKRNIIPEMTIETYVRNYHYYETIKGAKVYLSYAQKLVDEFVGKLFNDGYTFVHAEGKVEEIKPLHTLLSNSGTLVKDYKKIKDDLMFYRPFLSLPSVLENNFSKIYDNNPSLQFATKDQAKAYYNQHKSHFYLKAIKTLHFNQYLDDFLQFNKNYDDLISIENNFLKCECEKHIIIKPSPLTLVNDEEIEFTAHLLLFQPNYFDINYNEKIPRYVCLLSNKPLALINFDLFIPSNLLLKLYYLNTHFTEANFDDDAEDKKPEETIDDLPKWFSKKPKIPYTIFAKQNIAMDKYFTLKVSKEKMDLINFFFIYSLFLSTDAEMFFYYSLYSRKFSFCDRLFNSKETLHQLSYIFKHYDINYLNNKHHLKDYSTSQLNYENHLVKFCLIKHDTTDGKDEYRIDYEFISNCYQCVLREIENYYKFLMRCLQTEEDRQKLLIDPGYLQSKEDQLNNAIDEDSSFEEPKIGSICRNMFNFSKMIMMMYGNTDIRGKTLHIKFKQFTYQQYFVYNYGILTRSGKDYKKCLLLDYNMKVMRYKINIKNLGDVKKKFSSVLYTKQYHFFPNEILQKVNFATIDQLHLFTLFPVILFKVQNSLVYYYYTYLLMNRFGNSFDRLEVIDMKLISGGLNAKSTMELENYERLEFLGDAVLKLVSSIEMFMKNPNANRDLLFAKRRVVENNKSLFEKGKEVELYQYLFTSPITLKRVIIPGFSKDESLLFDISYNRSFTKNCYMHKRKVMIEKEGREGTTSDNANDTTKAVESSIVPVQGRSILSMIKEENEMENEKKNEKTTIEVTYTHCNTDVVTPEVRLPVTKSLIESVVKEKIDIVSSKQFRFIYTKTLADLVESLIGFFFHSSLENNYSIDEALNSSSIFLNELSILSTDFLENLSSNWTVSLKDLKNLNCKFTNDQQHNYMRLILENGKYTFNHSELLYQAMTHPSILSDEKQADNFNYVTKSYQRLAFLGEAIVFLYVSHFVYRNNVHENESSLHKMRICGINHHLISLIAIDDLKLDDCLLKSGGDLNNDILNYKMKLKHIRTAQENKYKITNEPLLDENFVVVLCELFHSYIGAILLDSKSVKVTFEILDKILLEYLNNNATRDTFTEHPKVTILDEFQRKRQYFKRIRENGGNRIMMKFGQKKEEKYRKQKLYDYQLIIDKFVIYEEAIAYNRSTIKMAQERAKIVFLEICKEIERREKLRLHLSKFDLETILKYVGIKYRTLS